jgi:murein DD-endopeptidase MepM/ murein hydrolase activator NlpD
LQSPAPVAAILPGHFLLARPIAPPGNSLIDASYRYGSTQRGKRVLHHGVEMENDLGTPVLAAANGVVVVVGDDQETAYGPQTNFYGQLVILKHEFSGLAQPVFSLYGHLSQVSVRVGQTVKVGQIIGQVGMTGWAIGYHLHFEVRLGENRYENTRNPELWLQPATGSSLAVAPAKNDFSGSTITGAFAGRIVDINGQPLRIAKIVLLPKNAPLVKNRIFVESYDDQSMKRTDLTIQDLPEDYVLVPYSHQTLGRDDLWREDFAISNLPAGKYLFSFTVKKVYTLEIEIRPGQLTFITFPLVRD